MRADGSIAAWGLNNSGQVSNTPNGTGFTQVGAGANHSVALRADGSIVTWGADAFGQVSSTPGGTGFTQVSVGSIHALALGGAPATNTGSPYCFGDGSGISCPCSNDGNPGEGCANGDNIRGANLSAWGHASITNDTFQLNINGAYRGQPGMLIRGAQQLNAGIGLLAGNGLLCTGGQSIRSHVQFPSSGITSFTNFRGQPFGQTSFGAGVPANYQYWYRDVQGPCPGGTFNFSNAWTVTWLP